MINIANLGSANLFVWNKEYLVSVLSSGSNPIVKDPILLNAIKQVDRADFVPEKFRAQAYSDVDLDIGFNEKMTRPVVVAHMLSILAPKFGGKYLDIGTGTGYQATVLAAVAGETGFVYSFERIQWLWDMARRSYKKYQAKIKNLQILYRDGLEGLIAKAPFDGILVNFAIDEIPEALKTQLKVGIGKIVCPTKDYNIRVLVRKGMTDYEEEIIQGFVFESGKNGVA